MTKLLAPTVAGILILFAAARSSPASEPPAAPPDRPTFWIIPHTHWEGAVFKTREEYLGWGFLDAIHPDGFTEQQLRTIRENATTLKFTTNEFEAE